MKKMRGASTRETLDKSSLLKMPAKIKLVRGRGIKEHRVTKALPPPPSRPPPILQSENPRRERQ
jgi:hypothetical protein